MNTLMNEIEELKKSKKAVILAHYYVSDEVQQVADYIGDSFYLAKVAKETDAEIIVFCGVSFMGESAKILNPDKMVLMPDETADCAMAHMADVDYIEKVRKDTEDVAVVCYINSTAELKCHSDVCVTSSNAEKIVRAMPQQNIFFIPDENLGRYISTKVPEKNFIFNKGYCPVHADITKDQVDKLVAEHKEAKILVHPECLPEVVNMADYIGSTSGIIDFAAKDTAKEYIICTEMGVNYSLQKNNPEKQFFYPGSCVKCLDMKKITLEKIIDSLKQETGQVEVDKETVTQASIALNRMLELGNK